MLQDHFKDRLISVVLFGSVGRGDARPDSDVDILLVINALPEGRYNRRKLLEPVMDAASERGLTASFNCHIKSPAEAKEITVMYFDFPTDAKLLCDKSGFFKEIIHAVEKIIKRNGAVRKRWGRFYYWDLKPGASAEETFDIL